MEVFTVKEWEDNFDALLERVENGEHIGVIGDDGTAAVMIPIDDELYRIYTENNNEASQFSIWEVRLGSQRGLINLFRQISGFEVVRIHPLLLAPLAIW